MTKRDRSRGEEEEAEGGVLRAPAALPRGPFNNAFAAVLKAHPLLESAAAKKETPAPAQAKRVPAPARAVVRMERKGHGGKEVTVVEQLGLGERDLERWLKAMKQSLGCGGRVEGGDLVLQGDHREALRKLLEDRGVKKVTVG